MTLDKQAITAAAERIDGVYRSKEQIPQLSLEHPGMDLQDAYAIQSAWVDLRVAGGRRIIGHKIGLTSKAMQRTSQIDEPDYGVLLDDMQFADGTDIPVSRFVELRVEVELAFVLGRPLRGPDCTIFDVLSATDYVVPAIELIDARIQRFDPGTGRPRKVLDTISDNAASAGLVMGGRPVRPNDVDLRWVCALMSRNGVVEDSGVAAAVMNHPANGLVWLANKLAAFGVGLEAGQAILSGSFTAPLAARAGDTFHVDYNTLGSLSCRFV
jgi:2-oxo-hept-3-ene-1,7-dioate hydratase